MNQAAHSRSDCCGRHWIKSQVRRCHRLVWLHLDAEFVEALVPHKFLCLTATKGLSNVLDNQREAIIRQPIRVISVLRWRGTSSSKKWMDNTQELQQTGKQFGHSNANFSPIDLADSLFLRFVCLCLRMSSSKSPSTFLSILQSSSTTEMAMCRRAENGCVNRCWGW